MFPADAQRAINLDQSGVCSLLCAQQFVAVQQLNQISAASVHGGMQTFAPQVFVSDCVLLLHPASFTHSIIQTNSAVTRGAASGEAARQPCSQERIQPSVFQGCRFLDGKRAETRFRAHVWDKRPEADDCQTSD